MKRLTNVFFALLVVAVVTALVAPAALAGCSPSTRAANVDRPFYSDATYIGFSNASGCVSTDRGGAGCPGFNGRWWQTNNTANDNGTYDSSQWLNGGFGADFWYFIIATGAEGTGPCTTDCMTVFIEDPETDEFILWTSAQAAPVGGNNFNFMDVIGGYASFAPGQSPRPRISGVSRDGANTVTVNFDVLDPSAGVFTEATPCGTDGSIANMHVYSQCSVGAPSLAIADGWALEATIAGGTGGSSSFSFDCAACGGDLYVATGLEVSGGGQFFLTNPSIVECDPNLADPKREFKVIDKGDRIKPKKM